MDDRTLVEVCCSSIDSVLKAQRCGADRIELCKELRLDGLTPDDRLLERTCTQSSLPIHVLIRPREGDFHYSREELSLINQQIQQALEYPISGIVVGHLSFDLKPDLSLLNEWRSMVQGMDLTFHRAFDHVKDPFFVLEQLIDAGFNRVLTSGQAPKAVGGMELLHKLSSKADKRITIMPGGGIDPLNAHLFLDGTFDAIHLSARPRDLAEGDEPVVDEVLLAEVTKSVKKQNRY